MWPQEMAHSLERPCLRRLQDKDVSRFAFGGPGTQPELARRLLSTQLFDLAIDLSAFLPKRKPDKREHQCYRNQRQRSLLQVAATWETEFPMSSIRAQPKQPLALRLEAASQEEDAGFRWRHLDWAVPNQSPPYE
jgi:hypothetical protein